MATVTYRMLPWDGGLNTSLDAALIAPNDLTIADNVVFAEKSSRKKRPGMDYWNGWESKSRSSSTTTRTLKFNCETTIQVGDTIHVLGPNDNSDSTNRTSYLGTYTVASVSTTTLENDTITYTGLSSLTEASTNDTAITVMKSGAALTTASRASSGTTRTLVVTGATYAVGDLISVNGLPNDYNGTFSVTGVSTTTTLNDTITYTASGSLAEATTADTNGRVIVNDMDSAVVACIDYWRNASGTKTQLTIEVRSDQAGGRTKLYKYDTNAIRTQIPMAAGASAFSGVINQVSYEVFNEKLILGFNGTSNTPKVYDPASSANLSNLSNAPNFSLVRKHLGRLFTNDKTWLDRLHYCETYNETVWNGDGDSGALDIEKGNGDPEGFTAIFPPFKGTLFVGKRQSLFRVDGDAPENFTPNQVGAGIGCVSHNSVVSVDQDDIYFASERGFHNLKTTDAYGDFSGSFISAPIQTSYNSFATGRLKYIQGAYISSLNSVVWSVSEDGYEENEHLYLLNVQAQKWYRWPDVSAASFMARSEGNNRVLYIGDYAGRIIKTGNVSLTDFGTRGISYRVKTGVIYVDGDPYTVKGFKKLALLYKPRGAYSFTVKFTVDNYSTQTLTFSQSGSTDALGDDFTLGTSELGSSPVLAPYTQPVDGYGHGCTIEIEQSSAGQDIEIYGYIIEYEPAGTAQEVVT